MSTKIEIIFTHPRNASSFTADVSSLCTGEEAIEGLLERGENGPFLDPAPAGRPYELALKRTGQFLSPKMTFEQVGAIDGDVIEVRQAGTGGGGFDFSEIAGILVTSGVTLAALKGLIQIVVKLIESEGEKAVTVKFGEGKEITITGSNSVNDLIKAVAVLEQHELNRQLEDGDS